MKMRIVLAEDNKIFCEGMRSLLEQVPNMEVVGSASDGIEAVRLVRALKPDVVIIEVAMPNLNGIEATRQIQAANGHTKVVALTAHAEKAIVTQMLRVGASAYLLKDCAFEELVVALHAVGGNHAYLCAEITQLMIEQHVRTNASLTKSVFDILTPREHHIMQLVAEGQSTKGIAKNLALSDKTVSFHRHQMMKKLNLHSVAELTKYAVRQGITDLNG